VQTLFLNASNKVTRWWVGLKIRWLLREIDVPRRARVLLTCKRWCRRAIAKFREAQRRRSREIVRFFLYDSKKCGRFAIKRMQRQSRIFQRLAHAWVATRGGRRGRYARSRPLPTASSTRAEGRRASRSTVALPRRASRGSIRALSTPSAPSARVEARRRVSTSVRAQAACACSC